MAQIRHVSTYIPSSGLFGQNITDFAVASTAAGLQLYTATHTGGGIASYALTSAEAPISFLAGRPYTGSLTYLDSPQIRIVTIGGSQFVAPVGIKSGTSFSSIIEPAIGIGAASSALGMLPFDTIEMGQFATSEGSFLYTARDRQLGLDIWKVDTEGRLQHVAAQKMPFRDGQTMAEIDAITIAKVGTLSFAVSVSALANAVMIQQINANGTFGTARLISAEGGSGLSQPTQIGSVTVAGVTYLIVGSSQSSSLTVMRLTSSGLPQPSDHVIDESTTRFSGVTAMDTLTISGRGFVFVGGKDDGISIFTVLPGGTLLHMETLADRDGWSLQNIASIKAQIVGTKIALFVSSKTEPGITQFLFDPGTIGVTTTGNTGNASGTAGDDIIRAGSGTTQIFGGAGDDTLMAGQSNISLTGGAGADTFVATSFKGRITIRDFELGVDRLDLTNLGMVRSTAQLVFSSQSYGIKIFYADAVINIYSSDGRMLSAHDFSNAMFPHAHYSPITLANTVYGSSLNDTLSAAVGANFIYGGGGHDLLLGSDLNDYLYGGADNDTIYGGNGNDRLFGGLGNDLISSSTGNDLVLGGDGNDVIYGAAGNDTLRGDAGSDLISGGDGNDSITGGDGNDTLYGDAGNDHLHGDAGNDSIFGGAGNDTLTALLGNNRLYGGLGNDSITSGAGRDTMFGQDGNDRLTAGAGDDLLYGGTGHDRLHGGIGNDKLYGGAGNDTIYGESGNDRIYGGPGRNAIYAGSGTDLIDAGADADLVYGGSDADTIYGGTGNDTIYGDTADDKIYGGDGNDRLDGGVGNDSLLGGPGNDLMTAREGNDRIWGQDGNDRMFGHGGHDTVYGGAGNDVIYGSSGRDMLYGGSGYDTIYGEIGNDLLDGAEGNDALYGGQGNDTLYGRSGNDALYGDSEDDRLYGDGGRDTLYGGSGSDRLEAGSGNDLLYGGTGHDTLVGGFNDDRLFGGHGSDVLYGSSGNDYVNGGQNSDRLYGGAGRDTLVGGHGSDSLWGGSSVDIFEFRDRTAFDRSIDFIGDFERGIDKLDFRGLGLSFIGAAQFSQRPQVRTVSTKTGIELHIDLNGDRSVDLTIKLHGTMAISISDFLL